MSLTCMNKHAPLDIPAQQLTGALFMGNKSSCVLQATAFTSTCSRLDNAIDYIVGLCHWQVTLLHKKVVSLLDISALQLAGVLVMGNERLLHVDCR